MSDIQGAPAEETIFICPKCGSREWGTYFKNFPDTDTGAMGSCHGYIAVGRAHQDGFVPSKKCNFTWPREDDHKYFKGTGVFKPVIQVAVGVKKT